MQNSIRKYLERPIVQLTSTTKFHDIKLPFIYVCQTNQFNFSSAKKFGYNNTFDFIKGNLMNSKHVSWSGKYNNRTYEEMKKMLYDFNHTNSEISTYSVTNDSYKIEDQSIVFDTIQGFCAKLEEVKIGMVKVKTKTESKIYLVDPFWSNPLGLLERENKVIEIGSNINGVYDSLAYDVQISLHDSRTNDGVTCTDYDKLGTSYGQCSELVIKQLMLQWFGCLLPWLSKNSYNTCKKIDKNESISQMLNDMAFFVLGKETGNLQLCKPPCKTLKLDLKRVDHWKTSNISIVRLSTFDVITVYTDTAAYDIFSLVVDLGSALGLWLGLSAVSIFGSIVDCFTLNPFSKLRYCKKCQKNNTMLHEREVDRPKNVDLQSEKL